MRLALRADAGPEIGLGHVRRCTPLVRALRSFGADVSVLSTTPDEWPDDIAASAWQKDERALATQGFDGLVADWAVTDHATCTHFHQAGLALVLIGNSTPDAPARLTLRQSLRPRIEAGAVRSGAAYLLLPPDLVEAPAPRTGPQRLLVSLGGSQTGRLPDLLPVLHALLDGSDCLQSITLITPEAVPLFHDRLDVRAPCDTWLTLSADHDVALLAGGMSALEALASGWPCHLLPLNDPQRQRARELDDLGLARWTDPDAQDWAQDLSIQLHRLLGEIDLRTQRHQAGRQHIDTRGAHRCAQAILDALKT